MTNDERWFPSHLKELGEPECLERLAEHHVGRVAYCDDLGPVVLPVNYAVDQGTILIQTSPHSTLASRLRTAPRVLSDRRVRRVHPDRLERPGPRIRGLRRPDRPAGRRRPPAHMGGGPALAPHPNHSTRDLGPPSPARLTRIRLRTPVALETCDRSSTTGVYRDRTSRSVAGRHRRSPVRALREK